MPLSNKIRSGPLHILWHYALGEMPDFLDKVRPPVGWVRWSHRGVHRLDNVVFPKRQERYVRSPKFDYRVNGAFEETLLECGKPDRFGQTWMTKELIAGLLQLHKMGYAHSWEAWQDGKLAGGVYGLQIGGWVNMSSMFYRVSHASKAALGRGLLQLKEQGFEWVDRGMVPKHDVDYGVEWWSRWRYEAAIPALLKQQPSVAPGIPCAPVPWQIMAGSPVMKVVRGLKRRAFGEKPDPVVPTPPPAAPPVEDAAAAAQSGNSTPE